MSFNKNFHRVSIDATVSGRTLYIIIFITTDKCRLISRHRNKFPQGVMQ